MGVYTTEIASDKIASDNPIHQRLLKAYILVENLVEGDLLEIGKVELIRAFGKPGAHFYKMARAEDDREVKPNRIRKSIGAERTFIPPLMEYSDLADKLREVHQSLSKRMEHQNRCGKTITLKLKYADFEIKSKSKSLPNFTKDSKIVWETAIQLLTEFLQTRKPVRLLGISLSNLDGQQQQNDGQLTLSF